MPNYVVKGHVLVAFEIALPARNQQQAKKRAEHLASQASPPAGKVAFKGVKGKHKVDVKANSVVATVDGLEKQDES